MQKLIITLALLGLVACNGGNRNEADNNPIKAKQSTGTSAQKAVSAEAGKAEMANSAITMVALKAMECSLKVAGQKEDADAVSTQKLCLGLNKNGESIVRTLIEESRESKMIDENLEIIAVDSLVMERKNIGTNESAIEISYKILNSFEGKDELLEGAMSVEDLLDTRTINLDVESVKSLNLVLDCKKVIACE